MAPGWRKHSGWHAAGPRVLLLNHNNCYPTNVDPISEAITALPAEIRRHFSLESVPGESSSRPLGKLLDLTGLAVLVTGAVAFLVSEAGEYINGTELSVGGGQSA